MKQKAYDHGWEIKTAIPMLSYLKKLILHPYLLLNSPLEKKLENGYISYEEELQLKEKTRQALQNEQNYISQKTRGARSC